MPSDLLKVIHHNNTSKAVQRYLSILFLTENNKLAGQTAIIQFQTMV